MSRIFNSRALYRRKPWTDIVKRQDYSNYLFPRNEPQGERAWLRAVYVKEGSTLKETE